MSNKFLFTEKAIKALPLPEKDRVEYFDTKEASLQLRVSKTGVKTFYWFRWVKSDQKTERIMIGQAKDISIETARRKCDEYNGVMALGENPNAMRRAVKAEIAFKELFDLYMNRHSKAHKRSWETDNKFRENHLEKQPFYTKRLSAITKNEIASMHADIGAEYPTTANRVLALVSSVFGRAIEWGIMLHNPCKGIRRFREQSRERFLQKEEIITLFESLDKMTNVTMRDYFKILLFTGARRANVLAMRWSEVNLDEQVWNIPDTKNKTSQVVPLLPLVVEILKQRPRESIWVFSSKSSKSGHLEEPKKVWAKLLEDAKISNLHLHDLRRTLGSWMTITGASLTIVGKALNHKSATATQVYARLNVDPVRAAMEKAIETMQSFKKDKTADNTP